MPHSLDHRLDKKYLKKINYSFIDKPLIEWLFYVHLLAFVIK